MWFPENEGWDRKDRFAALQLMQTNSVFRAVLASIPRKRGSSTKLPPPLVIPMPGSKKKNPKSWIREWATKAAPVRRPRKG